MTPSYLPASIHYLKSPALRADQGRCWTHTARCYPGVHGVWDRLLNVGGESLRRQVYGNN